MGSFHVFFLTTKFSIVCFLLITFIVRKKRESLHSYGGKKIKGREEALGKLVQIFPPLNNGRESLCLSLPLRGEVEQRYSAECSAEVLWAEGTSFSGRLRSCSLLTRAVAF